jgi:PGF-CTERM protein
VTQAVNNDGTFEYEIDGGVTSGLTSGTYFVVVQHPMYNDVLDIYPTAADGYPFRYVVLVVPYYILFTLEGPGSLPASDAAFTLLVLVSDSTIDDTFASTQFVVEVPEIRIFPLSEKNLGDTFLVNGTTNLEAGDELHVEVISSSFNPTLKEFPHEFSGTAGTVKVVEGNNGINTWSFPVDTVTFIPDQYIVTVSAIGLQSQQDVTASQLFNVIEYCYTATPVSSPPTTTETPVPPSSVPIITTTPTAPGFGLLVALTGLGVVAFLIMRRD